MAGTALKEHGYRQIVYIFKAHYIAQPLRTYTSASHGASLNFSLVRTFTWASSKGCSSCPFGYWLQSTKEKDVLRQNAIKPTKKTAPYFREEDSITQHFRHLLRPWRPFAFWYDIYYSAFVLKAAPMNGINASWRYNKPACIVLLLREYYLLVIVAAAQNGGLPLWYAAISSKIHLVIRPPETSYS